MDERLCGRRSVERECVSLGIAIGKPKRIGLTVKLCESQRISIGLGQPIGVCESVGIPIGLDLAVEQCEPLSVAVCEHITVE